LNQNQKIVAHALLMFLRSCDALSRSALLLHYTATFYSCVYAFLASSDVQVHKIDTSRTQDKEAGTIH
jgi:hypothetical protein